MVLMCITMGSTLLLLQTQCNVKKVALLLCLWLSGLQQLVLVLGIRPTGKFAPAKPPFDPSNPLSVSGSLRVDGIDEVGGALHASFTITENCLQRTKELIAKWCAEETAADARDDGMLTPRGSLALRWHAYENCALPRKNEVLDRDVLGLQVGCYSNVERIVVCADFETGAPELGAADRAATRMDAMVERVCKDLQGKPFRGPPTMNRFTRLLHRASAQSAPAPESALAVMQTVQANWASAKHIVSALNETVLHFQGRFDACKGDLLRVDVFRGANDPHVIKTVEVYADSSSLVEAYHRHYQQYLEVIAPHRAAVSPVRQGYVPICFSARPKMSLELPGLFKTMPQLALILSSSCSCAGGFVRAALALGIRHFVLQPDDQQDSAFILDGLEIVQAAEDELEGAEVFLTVIASPKALPDSSLYGRAAIDCLICVEGDWRSAEEQVEKGAVLHLGLSIGKGCEGRAALSRVLSTAQVRPQVVQCTYGPTAQDLELLRTGKHQGLLLLAQLSLGSPGVLRDSLELTSVSDAAKSLHSQCHPSPQIVITKWLMEQGIAVSFKSEVISDVEELQKLGRFFLPITQTAGIVVEGGGDLHQWLSVTGRYMPELKEWGAV